MTRWLPDALRPWLGAAMLSLSAVWVRLADVEPLRSALLRTAYALPVIAVVMLLRRERRWIVPGGLLAGALLGIDFMAWHESIRLVGAGLGTVLPNLQVVFVGIAGVLLFGERPRRAFWIALPIVMTGVWLLGSVGHPVVAGGSMAWGVVWGIVTAIAYAGVLVAMRVVRRRIPIDAVSGLWALTLGATLATLPAAASQGVAGPAGWPADGWLVALAIGSQVIGWLLLTSSIHRLPATATSIALLTQPILALAWGAMLLGEPLGAPQLAGAAIVLSGVVLAHRGTTTATVTPPAG
ncbi:MAG: DMT family transporter [Nitriliruptoraceae bacterium]